MEQEVRRPKAAVLFEMRPKAASMFERVIVIMGAGSTLRRHFDAFRNLVFMLRGGDLNIFM